MIPHLEQQIAFLTACRDHGPENVEWRVIEGIQDWSGWWPGSSPPYFQEQYKFEFRIRPRTHVIPKTAVPMPLKVKPERGQRYWSFNVGLSSHTFSSVWEDDQVDEKLFNNNMCFATREDAEANLAAMLAREEE